MRVVGGSAKGTTLSVVPGHGTRPVLDRVKTSLFDILRPRLAGMAVLDLFAGSGAVGIEALSQGAESCTFLDLGAKAVATIRKNLAATGLSARAEVRHGDAFAYLGQPDRTFDLIYVAPPQYRGLWAEALRKIASRPELVRKAAPGDKDSGDGLVIAQIDPKEDEPLDLGPLRETRRSKLGNTLLIFYEFEDGPGTES